MRTASAARAEEPRPSPHGVSRPRDEFSVPLARLSPPQPLLPLSLVLGKGTGGYSERADAAAGVSAL